MSFPSQVSQTFPENWPGAMLALAAPMVSIPLTEEDADALGGFSTVYRRQMQSPATEFLSDALLDSINKGLAQFPEGIMPRIGYCSWKASLLENRPAVTQNDVLQILTTDDPRVGNALSVQVSSGDPVYLHLRAWRQIPDWSEIRLFFRGGRFLGASQYAYRTRHQQISSNAKQIEDLVATTAVGLLGHLHLSLIHISEPTRPY